MKCDRVLALVKGLVEHGDATAYFSPLDGFEAVLNEAVSRGLVANAEPRPLGDQGYFADSALWVTDLGRDAYCELGLAWLPRQYLVDCGRWDWDGLPDRIPAKFGASSSSSSSSPVSHPS